MTEHGKATNGTAQDIQRLALRDSEAKYRMLFDKSSDGILIADVETKTFRYANPAAARILGHSQSELCTMDQTDIHTKDCTSWRRGEIDDVPT